MLRKCRSRGFTLVELMIVLVISALLASIAYPSYMSSVRKSRRADALQALYTLQLAQEKWRALNPAYGTLSDLGLSSTSEAGYYTIAITLPSPPADQTSYTATATAVAGGSQVNDKTNGVSCSTLKVDQNGAVYDPAGQSACWGK